MLFVSHLHTESLAPGTIKTYLAAIRFEQISRGMGNPEIHGMPLLEYVIKGTGASDWPPVDPDVDSQLLQLYWRS